jgi:CheY-like chemotaxis protein
VGLGLSIARRLVEAHQGTILAESEGKDLGSTFIVRLPAPQRPDVSVVVPVHDPPAPARNSKPVRLDGIRVLVVDDEPDTREVMAHALEACGARVTLASSAREALEILERSDVDVLLSDVAMPEEDGYTLIRKVRASPAGRISAIPAAAVTAHARDDERQRALSAGFHVHLAKPIELGQLARTVETLFRGTSITNH